MHQLSVAGFQALIAQVLRKQILQIPGPAGALEALLEFPATMSERASQSGDKKRPDCAVICHPHPQQGGTLHNKVVHTLARAFHEHDWATLRFNFRGVGASVGSFDNGVGETGDACAVAQWAEANLCDTVGCAPQSVSLALAGFSFGGAVAFNVAARLQPTLLLTVAPAVDRVTVSEAQAWRNPWLIVQGAADDVVSATQVQAWAAARSVPPTLVLLPGVGHFFHGALNELRSAASGFLGQISGKKKPDAD